MTGILELNDPLGAFQQKPFYDSRILIVHTHKKTPNAHLSLSRIALKNLNYTIKL